MDLLNEIVINRPQRGEASIQLLQGNLAAIPKEQAADILIISAYPGNYTPLPGTLLAALYDKGIDVAAMAKNKATDLRKEMGCWLSQPLDKEQEARVNFKKILCFEPRAQMQEEHSIADNDGLEEDNQEQLADKTEEWWNMMAVKVKKDNAGLQFRYTTGSDGSALWEPSGGMVLAEMLIKEKTTSTVWDKATAITIFELLIPAAHKTPLKQSQNISWLLDKETAALPWELLQDNADEAPLCIKGGMIRQLANPVTRRNTISAGKGKALVIGDPLLGGFMSQLPAAAAEARQTEKALLKNNYTCETAINLPADQMVLKLFSDDYIILHFSGYGVFNEGSPGKSGLLLGKGIFLTALEIEQLNKLPELVFINTGQNKTDGLPAAYYEDRNKLAAVLGTQLIQLGIKAVVITGWAVDDSAACDFTETFYEHLLNGAVFWKAVQQARKMVYEKYAHFNTWGAYQCYGDPFYTLTSKPFEQEQLVGNIFQCINTFAFNKNNNVIVMPVLATGHQGVQPEKMLPALIDASIFWLEKGLPLQCIKMVLFSAAQSSIALPIFSRAKEKNNIKQGLLNGSLTPSQAIEKVETIKTQALPGEASMQIVSSEIKRLAPGEKEIKKSTSHFSEQAVLPQPGSAMVESVVPADNNGYDYFISYAHKHGAIVDEFVNNLIRKNGKLKIFYDKTTIEPGGLWIKDISDAIEKSKKVLIFLAPDYTNSTICWAEFQCAQLKEFNEDAKIISTIYLYSMKIPLIMGIHSFINCREADKLELEKAATQLSSL